MTGTDENSKQIFSFHLVRLPLLQTLQRLLRPLHRKPVPGLLHSESFFTMNLGAPVASAPRYNLTTLAFFAWWEEERHLDEFLRLPEGHFLKDGWHVRMKLYRRWGEIQELRKAIVTPGLTKPEAPMVAVTLARLKILQTPRFVKWGKPVESQVRDHRGQKLALAAFRPLRTFATFSIWNTEAEMIDMVQGRNMARNGESHKLAMQERSRKDFHHEFTTMRFAPFKEEGSWNGKQGYTAL